MKAPEFYAEWIPILRDFAVRKDDDEVITAMKNGCIPLFTDASHPIELSPGRSNKNAV